jgi:hypothetical protein
LVRRLVLETGRSVVQLGFPAGEGVSTGSWDGTVRATEATAFIPNGLSLWELSVDKSPGVKADSDYGKRLTTPDGAPTSDCVYIAVALRRWAKRAEWARQRTAEGRWKEVRVLGVDDVETWLEAAPVTHAWISDLLGLGPHGLRAAEAWWQVWASATTPALSPEVVLAGRAELVTALRERLGGEPQVTSIRGGSLQEVLAFVAATTMQAAQQGDGQPLARTAFVDDLATWRSLSNHRDRLILVPLDAAAAEATATNSHHVVVPVIGGARADIDLSPIDATDATAALKAAGLEDERRADSAGRLARRSLVALRRRLANKPELDQPTWADRPDRVVRSLLLAGAWHEGSDGDREVLSTLTGIDHESLRERLAVLRAEQDPLVAGVGRAWALVSPYDAWLQLRASLREDDLARLRTAVREVLLEVDPALELAVEDRWRASLDGKVRAYSSDLRRGLTTTLALLGFHGEDMDPGDTTTGAEWAAALVREIMSAANNEESTKLWASLSYSLPLLAEAAPDRFLDGVRSGLHGETPLLAGLFNDREDGGNFSQAPAHTGLLWALETVAWTAEHFSGAVDALARLAELDPGNSRWANRPFNSLRSIFCPWHPDTSVDIDRRLRVIDGLRQRHPNVAWRLMLALLPELHGVHDPTHEPEFREWVPPRKPVLTVDYWAFVRALVPRLIEDADGSAKRWAALIDEATGVPPDDRRAMREELATRAQARDVESSRCLWESLRAFIAKHREFADADWALPVEELAELEALERVIAPEEPSVRLAWLFVEHWPDLGDEDGRQEDYEGRRETLARRRREALAEIEEAEGFEGVRLLASRSLSWLVGTALADATDGEYDEELLRLTESNTASEAELARGYLVSRFTDEGWPFIDDLLAREPPLSAAQRATLLIATGDVPKSWKRAAAEGHDVADAYWRSFSYLGLGKDFPHVAEAIACLFRVGRRAAGLDMLAMYVDDAGNDPEELAALAADGLEALLHEGSETEPTGLSQHDLRTLFSHLEAHEQAVGWERVARLEWGYLGALGYGAHVPTLNRLLATDPGFFVQVMTVVFREKSADAETETSPERQRMATNGYRLLSVWTTLPGVGEDGKFDGAALRTWVSEALTQLEEVDRRDIGEDRIGHVLSYSPAGNDGIRPAPEVRDLLEELQSAVVEEALRVGFYNQRGTTSRDPEEGGEQERRLAARYREEADRVVDQWPRTAAILRDLAKSYENDARRYDSEAEKRRRGLD